MVLEDMTSSSEQLEKYSFVMHHRKDRLPMSMLEVQPHTRSVPDKQETKVN